MRTDARDYPYLAGMAAMLALVLAVASVARAEFRAPNHLEIHYINVGQGGSTLIIGPNGTRILYDFGAYDGQKDIVPYLRDVVRLAPTDGLHYTIVSHRDRDHYAGYRGVVESGYDVLVANYDSGSRKASDHIRVNWLNPARRTTAGQVRAIPLGTAIAMGDGAEAIVVAANGRVHGEQHAPSVRNENDKSVALLIRYRNFHYLIDGDLGAGSETCTDHETPQKDIQSRVARALIGLGLLTEAHGVDVLHVSHHGSESSTSADYYNLMKPEVALISVGKKNQRYLHPRRDVVDKVLLGPNRPDCVLAPPVKQVFQTEDGEEGCSATGCTSFLGRTLGDIRLTTDGRSRYTITGTGKVHSGRRDPNATKEWKFPVDEAGR